MINSKPKSLKSDMADGRHIGKYVFWLLLHNCLSDLHEILYKDAKTDQNNGRTSYVEFWKFKMADGFALKRYGRRCYSILLEAGAYRLDRSGWYVCLNNIVVTVAVRPVWYYGLFAIRHGATDRRADLSTVNPLMPTVAIWVQL